MKAFWWVVNPPARRLAGVLPFWIVLETTGRRSGRPRRVPLARGADFDGGHWIIASHGPHAAFVQNIRANPAVRVRMRGRWRTGTATVQPVTEDRLQRFSSYARTGVRAGIDPCLVRIALD